MTDEDQASSDGASAVPPTRSARGYPKPFASRVAGGVRRAGRRLWPDALSRDRERSDDVDPGQPSEPVYDYHGRDDRFCGAIDPMCCDLDFWRAVPCLGEAGSIAVHHVRTVHVSATNFPGSERRLLLFQYRGRRLAAAQLCWRGREIRRLVARRQPNPDTAPSAGAGPAAVAVGRISGVDLREPACRRPAALAIAVESERLTAAE